MAPTSMVSNTQNFALFHAKYLAVINFFHEVPFQLWIDFKYYLRPGFIRHTPLAATVVLTRQRISKCQKYNCGKSV